MTGGYGPRPGRGGQRPPGFAVSILQFCDELCKEKETYVAQELDDVVEVLGLLKLVTQFHDSLTADQVLGDLSPSIAATWRGRRGRRSRLVDGDTTVCDLLIVGVVAITSALIDNLHAQSPLALNITIAFACIGEASRRGGHNTLLIAVRDELGATHAAILLPGHLCSGAAHTIHAHTFSSGGHVDDGPVLGDAVIRLTHLASLVNSGLDLVSLIIIVDNRGGGRAGAGSRDASPALNVKVNVLAVSCHHDVIIVGIHNGARWALNRAPPAVGVRVGVLVDINLCPLVRCVDVNLGITVLMTGRRRGRRGWPAGNNHSWYILVCLLAWKKAGGAINLP